MFDRIRQMISGKSEAELRTMAQNIAAERGINLQQFANSLGIRL